MSRDLPCVLCPDCGLCRTPHAYAGPTPPLVECQCPPTEDMCRDCGQAHPTGDCDDTLHCDLCSRVEHADDLTPDWNGETGNHLSCEAAYRA